VAGGVNTFQKERPDTAVMVITHYQRLLNYIQPHFVHVIVDGRIVQSGGPEVAVQLEEEGYANWTEQEATAGIAGERDDA
jgi:Fe-S cluster assembly ATP-binding protein